MVTPLVAVGTATSDIYSFEHDKRRIYLIDTPGFDDTHRSDTDVLKEIAFFMSQTYRREVKLAGIVYLHRITDNRFGGSSVKNINLFKKLCGEDAYQHVALATTMWGNLSTADGSFDRGVDREQELCSREGFWGRMHGRGSKVVRWLGDRQSALEVVDHLVAVHGRSGKAVLQIQRELVDQRRPLDATAAGQEVQKDILQATAKYQAEIQGLKEGYEAAMRDRDQRLAADLLQQKRLFEGKLDEANRAQADLKTGLERLAAEKMAEYNRLLEGIRAEQDRTEASLRAGEREAQRLTRESEENHAVFREAQAEFRAQRRDLERQMDDMERRQDRAARARAADEKRRLAELEKELTAQFEEEKLGLDAKQKHTTAVVKAHTQRFRKRDTLIPFISMLAGLGSLAVAL